MSGQISGKPVDVTHTFSMLTSQQIADAFHCPLPLALRWTDALNRAMARVEINTPRRIAAFIAQMAHESANLSRLAENLNYTADADRRYPVPVGFVRVHRAATTGTAAASAGDLDGEASDIALSAVAEVDAQNYTECRKWQAQVIGWQEYY
jgi:hypothetical protein